MATSTQLIDLDLNEISGVDHPANLHEGWLVLKASTDPLEKALAAAAEAITDNNNGESNMELTHDETTEEVVKEAAPIVDEGFRKEVADLRKELADARAETEKVTADRELEKATVRAAEWAELPGMVPAEFAPVLRSLHNDSPETAELIEGILDKCVTALGEADVLKEIGTEETSGDASAWDKLEGLAKALVEAGDAKSIADGIGKAAEAHPDVYAAYINEKEA